jgi:hypothetical protein
MQKSLHTEHKLFHGSFYSWHLACNRHSFLTLLHATKEIEKVNIEFWLIDEREHIKVSLTPTREAMQTTHLRNQA